MNLGVIKLAIAVATMLGADPVAQEIKQAAVHASNEAKITDADIASATESRQVEAEGSANDELPDDGIQQASPATAATDENLTSVSVFVVSTESDEDQTSADEKKSSEKGSRQNRAQKATSRIVVGARQVTGSDDKKGDVVVMEDGGASMVISRLASTSSDAEDAPVISGKILVTTPDGKVVEYDLGSAPHSVSGAIPPTNPGTMVFGNFANGEIGNVILERLSGKSDEVVGQQLIEVSESGERLMLGILCEAADELLRKHLKSGENGLVVQEVVEDSAAEKAGLAADDVLLQAGDTPLKTPVDLSQAVTQAGETEMVLSLIREGERMSISVTPKLTKLVPPKVFNLGWAGEDAGESSENLQKLLEQAGFNGGNQTFQFRQFSPGIVIDKSAGAEDIAKLVKEAMSAAQGAVENTQSSEQALKKQIEELEKQVEEMASRIAEIENKKPKAKK